MAVSDSVKVDLLLKKLYGVAKTDTAANKSPSNEAISSPLLIRGDTIWTQANSIPTTAASLAGVVQSYLTTSRIECTPDTTTQRISGTVYPTWRTNLTNWIAPEFDTVNLINTYRVKVYYGAAGLADPASSGGTQIFADGSGSTGEWYFDYVTGTLNLIGGTIPSGMTGSSVIYIYGYRYIGSTTINTLQSPVNTNFSITTTGTGTVELTTNKLNVSGDLGVNGGDITTNQTTFNLINDTATTVNFAGAATTIEIGATTGTTNINNNLEVGGNITPTLDVTYDLGSLTNRFRDLYLSGTSIYLGNVVISSGSLLEIDSSIQLTGDTLSTTSATFNLANTAATAVNFIGAASTINMGANSGTLTIGNPTVVGTQATQNLYNTVATTVNAFGDATTLNIGNAATATVTLRPGTLVGSNTTQNVYDTVATTVNFAGAATTVNIGATSPVGLTTIRHSLQVDGNFNLGNDLTINGDLGVNGGDITTTSALFNLINANATTVNFAGAATTLEIGAATGTTNINNNLDVDGDVNIDGGDLTVSAATFNLATTAATTVNFALAATTLEIGAATGTTNINNNLDVDGDVNIDGGDLTVSTPTFNLANTTATTVNAFGDATGINIGNATTATITLRPGTLVGSNAIQDVYNTVATTVNAFGAATTLNIGNATTATVLLRPGTLVGSNTTQNLYDTVATTVNFAGAATSVNIGDNTGTLTTRNPTVVGTQAIQNVYNTVATTVNAFGDATTLNIGNAATATVTLRPGTLVGSNTTQNVYNTVATTVNAFGAATTISIGAATGKTTINSTDNSTTSTTGALVVSGGIGVANDIVGAGFTTDPVTGATTEISSIKSFVIDEGEY